MHFRVQLLSVVAARLGVSVGRAIAGATDPRLDASVGRVIAGAMASAGQRPMVVRPSELTQPGRLDGAKRLLGRLVEVEHVPTSGATSSAATRLATSSPSRRGASWPNPLPLF